MVEYYVYRIMSGAKTLADVPPKWHDAVKQRLEELGYPTN